MIIRHPNQADWEIFSSLANSENWRVPCSELQLYKGPWSQYAHVLDDEGFCGLVTAVAYEKSAWIGNLIVPYSQRGKGYGSHLFKSVLASLVEQEMTSVWLTASEQGRSLYENEGFSTVDYIERWVLPPQQEGFNQSNSPQDSYEKLLCADSLVWGESRTIFLSELCNAGKTFSAADSVALLQQGPDLQIIGPWYSREISPRSNHDLLQNLIASSDPTVEIVIDLLASSPVRSLCGAFGFKCIGQTDLMVCGDIISVKLKDMMSLASLGSAG